MKKKLLIIVTITFICLITIDIANYFNIRKVYFLNDTERALIVDIKEAEGRLSAAHEKLVSIEKPSRMQRDIIGVMKDYSSLIKLMNLDNLMAKGDFDIAYFKQFDKETTSLNFQGLVNLPGLNNTLNYRKYINDYDKYFTKRDLTGALTELLTLIKNNMNILIVYGGEIYDENI